MRNFLTLFKINMRLNFGISALKYRFTKEKKKRWEPILIGLCALLGFGSILVMYILMMNAIFDSAKMMGNPEIILTIGFLTAQLFVLIFGIFYIMGSFYFSKDIEMLIPLPLKPYEVLGSKFLVILVNEYLTVVPMLLTPMVIYGIGTGQSALYWLKSIPLLLASPIIPLVLSALIIMILMRFVNFRKSKDLFAIIGGFFGLALALGINLLMSRIPKEMEGDFFNGLLQENSRVIEEVGRKFPPSIWATFGLYDHGVNGWVNFLIFMGVSIVLFAVLLWIGNHVFYQSILSGQEVSKKSKKLSKEESNRRFGTVSTPIKALFLREWRLFLRTPIYILNGLGSTIMGPVMFGFIYLSGQQESDFNGDISAFLSNPELVLTITLIGLAIVLFVATMNTVASTAISREGSTFWISKVIPVKPRVQVAAKMLTSLCVTTIGMALSLILFAVFLKLSLLQILFIGIFGMVGSVYLTALNIIIDVLRPKLNWKNPTEAMKQNINAFFGMLISFLGVALLAGLALLCIFLKAQDVVIYVIVATAMMVLAFVSTTVLFRIADKRYNMIEM